MYWKESYRTPMFSSMSRNRFFSIRTNLDLVNNLKTPQNNTDKFLIVRPIFDVVRNRCQQLHVETCVAVDEQVVPFGGHLSMK